MEWILPGLWLVGLFIVGWYLFKLVCTSSEFRKGFLFACTVYGGVMVASSTGKAIGAVVYWLYKAGLS